MNRRSPSERNNLQFVEAYIHSENEAFVPTANDQSVLELIASAMAQHEAVVFGELSVVVMPSDAHTVLNIKYLDHNYPTDVLTFDVSFDTTISGDVYVNWEVCIGNAESFGVGVKDELYRLIAHGLLHLAGYDDATDEEKGIMREQEDRYLRLIQEKGFM